MDKLSRPALCRRLAVGAAVLAALAAGIGFLYRFAVSDAPWDWTRPFALQARLQDERSREAALDSEVGEAFQRVQAKQRVKADLIAGRITLFEAAARYRDLSAGQANYLRLLRAYYPGRSDEERLCRSVIDHVRHVLIGQRKEPDEFIASLEAELHEHLERYGTVRLPDVYHDELGLTRMRR
jgi:hypothetical protein